MEDLSLKLILEEMILKLNAVSSEVKQLRENTVSKDEYESLHKQIEILSLQVAKNIAARNNLLYFPHTKTIISNTNEPLPY
ncbi:hypothetical protein [Calidifontibacillus erzurumensis]|uniref:Uncharacterized protein n=1 Tax=Calidifontibacillus erzurumensis TaxID=2741433 RepID=A0A8J8GH79_9BACI|nr:hypothetical protein [Calidifontibacillus erzurumensis]NSL51748.1 hypothetical protein [Calidifontibacillus erzurumensis]